MAVQPKTFTAGYTLLYDRTDVQNKSNLLLKFILHAFAITMFYQV
jgi:hypothetical protein